MTRINCLNFRTGETLSKEVSLAGIQEVVEGKCFFCGGLLYTVQRELFPLNPELREVVLVGRCDRCWLDFRVESNGEGLRMEVSERLAEEGGCATLPLGTRADREPARTRPPLHAVDNLPGEVDGPGNTRSPQPRLTRTGSRLDNHEDRLKCARPKCLLAQRTLNKNRMCHVPVRSERGDYVGQTVVEVEASASF